MSTEPAPTEIGVRYGTDRNSLSSYVWYQGGITTAEGSYSVDLTGLEPETTYYYEVFMSVWNGTKYVEISRTGQFTTLAASVITHPGYLSCGEIPAVALAGTVTSGYYDNSTYDFGDTKWYRYGVSGNSGQVIVTHTFADDADNVYRNYTLLYDKSKKVALWAAFAMNADCYPWSVIRDDAWVYDPAINQSWQPNLSGSYASADGIEYDRGHQVASNDRRTTLPQTRQTTFFSNMTPQNADFNQGVWADLESDVQQAGKATKGRDTLYVVTGPIFGEGYTSTKDKNNNVCPVPTQYYKCLMKVTYNASGEVTAAKGEAIVMDNSAGSSRQVKTIREVEGLTGFDFFANIPSSYQKQAEENVTALIN